MITDVGVIYDSNAVSNLREMAQKQQFLFSEEEKKANVKEWAVIISASFISAIVIILLAKKLAIKK